MSLGKKTSAQMVVVSVNDPAIDRHSLAGNLALKRYMKERGDPDTELVYVEGARPTKFVLRPLSNQARTWVESQISVSLAHQLAFGAALVTVDDPDVQWTKVERQAAWGPILDAACLDTLAEHVGGKVIEEIGAVALQRANLSAAQKKAFLLPPGCEVDWGIGSPATASQGRKDD